MMFKTITMKKLYQWELQENLINNNKKEIFKRITFHGL